MCFLKQLDFLTFFLKNSIFYAFIMATSAGKKNNIDKIS